MTSEMKLQSQVLYQGISPTGKGIEHCLESDCVSCAPTSDAPLYLTHPLASHRTWPHITPDLASPLASLLPWPHSCPGLTPAFYLYSY